MTLCKVLVNSIDPNGAIMVTSVCRNDIPIGSTFTKVRKIRFVRDRGIASEEDLGIVECVSLTLQEVAWFDRSIAFIPDGHSARIVVSGSKLETVAAALAKCGAGEYVFLEGDNASAAVADDQN